jgi:hypothetical protein
MPSRRTEATDGELPWVVRGRPPLEPRTTFARWIRARHLTVKHVADQMADIAAELGLSRDSAPKAKTLLDSVNGRRCPNPLVMLLVARVTGGEVGLEDWVHDWFLTDRKAENELVRARPRGETNADTAAKFVALRRAR